MIPQSLLGLALVFSVFLCHGMEPQQDVKTAAVKTEASAHSGSHSYYDCSQKCETAIFICGMICCCGIYCLGDLGFFDSDNQ